MDNFKTITAKIMADEEGRGVYLSEIRGASERLIVKMPQLGPELSDDELEKMLPSGIGQMLESSEPADVERWMRECLELRRQRLDQGESGRELRAPKMR